MISALTTLSLARRHRSRILQSTNQRPNVAFRYAIALHKKSHRDTPKQLVQRWLGATLLA
jgi:hypothetical protein